MNYITLANQYLNLQSRLDAEKAAVTQFAIWLTAEHPEDSATINQTSGVVLKFADPKPGTTA